MKRQTRKGFTIVELIIVIAVIGVLAAILIPVFSNVIQKANSKSALSDARNTLTNYIVELTENGSLPGDIVIIVEKAGDFYAYGYQKSVGQFLESPHNPMKKVDTVDEVIAEYNMNYTDYLIYQTLEEGSEEAENLRNGDTFCLIPSSEEPAPAVKGRPALKSAEEFTNLNNALPEEAQLDGTEIYHGVLLGGVVAQLDGEGGEGGGSVVPDPTPTPAPKPKYQIAYDVVVNKPEDVTIKNIPAIQEYTEGDTCTTIEFVKDVDYTSISSEFMGWQIRGTDTQHNAGHSFTVTGQVIFDALWNSTRYNLTIDIKGNAQGNISFQGDPIDLEYSLIKGTDYKEILDKISDDWDGIVSDRTDEVLSGLKVEDENGVIIPLRKCGDITPLPINSNTKVTAVWGKTEYTLTYAFADPNMAFGTLPASKTFKYGDSVPIDASGFGYDVGDRSGQYVFKGWQLYSSGRLLTNQYFANDGTIEANYTTGHLQLRAVWDKMQEKQIDFSGMGFEYVSDSVLGANIFGITGLPGSKTYYVDINSTANVEVTLPTEIPTKSGYEFVKWGKIVDDGSGGNKLAAVYAPGGKLIITPSEFNMDITLYGLFRPSECYVEYNANGGTGSMNGSYVQAGVPFTPTANSFTRAGYEFTGWRIDSATDGRFVTPNEQITTNTDIVLYAQWSAITYTVTYNANGGTINGNATYQVTGVASGSTHNVIADIPVYSGFEFKGWSQSQSGSTISSVVVTGNVTLYAQWEQKITGDWIQITQESQLTTDFFDENGWDKNYIVMNDISLSGTTRTPIGWTNTADVYFTGVFDGNGKTISGLSLGTNNNSGSVMGLFAGNSGTIKNLNLGINKIYGSYHIGGVVGENKGTITNVHVTISDVIQSYSEDGDQVAATGGIVGMSIGGNISKCSVKGKVIDSNGWLGIGGICGWFESGTISECWFKGSIGNNIGAKYQGGIVGAVHAATIENCWAYVDKIFGYEYLGGIAGGGGNGTTIRNCWAAIADFYCRQVSLQYAANHVGAITSSSNNIDVVNCYYDSSKAFNGNSINRNTGTAYSLSSLRGTIPGFDTAIWSFGNGYNNCPNLVNNIYR